MKEVKMLSDRLKATRKFYAPRIEPENLGTAIREGRAAIRRLDDRIEAFAALWPTNDPGWYELGTIWVGERLRGNGLRQDLMAEVVALTPAGRGLFMFTPNEAIMDSAVKLGFVLVTTDTRPDVLLWGSRLGIAERLRESINANTPRASCDVSTEGMRRLFIRDADNRGARG